MDVLADSPMLARLESLRLPYGVLTAPEAARLGERWSAFSHLRRLDLTANAIPAGAARALHERAPDVVKLGYQRIRIDDEVYFDPPLVGLFGS